MVNLLGELGVVLPGTVGAMADELRAVLRSDELPSATGQEAERGAAACRPQSRQVDVDGTPVLLLRLASGEAVAVAACPHQGTPLRQSGLLAGEQVRCEQHGFVYDLRSGCNVLPTREVSAEARYRLEPGHLAIYDVVERDGSLWLAPTPRPAPADDTPPPPPAPAFAGGPPTAAEQPGDGPSPPPGPGSPEPLDAGVGEEVELTLPTRALPAHLWHVEVDGDAVEVLACTYANPWGEPAQVRTFVITVSGR